MNLIRYIKKLVAGKLVNVSFSPYSASPDLKSDVYFMDGVIGINSDSSVIVGKSDADTYAMIVSKAQDVITKNGLKDGDVFIGRNKNFVLFRNGNQTIKSTIINIHANELQFVGNKINFNYTYITSILNNSKTNVHFSSPLVFFRIFIILIIQFLYTNIFFLKKY
jgi:hypothetical protein